MTSRAKYEELDNNEAIAALTPHGEWSIGGDLKVGDRRAVVACHWFYHNLSAAQRNVLARLVESARDGATEGFSWIDGPHTQHLPEMIGRAFQAESSDYLRATQGSEVLFHKVTWKRALGATMCELFHIEALDADKFFTPDTEEVAANG